jgi:hypothetical protein
MKKNKGYSLIIAIIAVTILSILLLKARIMWETVIGRDMEEELIFRARQYVSAINLYKIKNNNFYPKKLKVLYEKKFLRKLYKDPISESKEWNVIMQPTRLGKKKLLIVPKKLVKKIIGTAHIIGVISTSIKEGFREYRGKKHYNEWAFYLGEQIDKDMPELKLIKE